MALKYPDRLESNNPAAYGIVKATEVSGHKTVQTLDQLYTLADAILSDSGDNTDNDAIGQLWYVVSEEKYYQLIDWNNRKSASGWEVQMTNSDILHSQVTADEEDITLVNQKLKLKDRTYDEANFSGKGYKILRKNIVEGKNILTQDMINESNTIYEIRYDFDLNEQAIDIPENCILKFSGGSFDNGQIEFNNCTITDGNFHNCCIRCFRGINIRNSKITIDKRVQNSRNGCIILENSQRSEETEGNVIIKGCTLMNTSAISGHNIYECGIKLISATDIYMDITDNIIYTNNVGIETQSSGEAFSEKINNFRGIIKGNTITANSNNGLAITTVGYTKSLIVENNFVYGTNICVEFANNTIVSGNYIELLNDTGHSIECSDDDLELNSYFFNNIIIGNARLFGTIGPTVFMGNYIRGEFQLEGSRNVCFNNFLDPQKKVGNLPKVVNSYDNVVFSNFVRKLEQGTDGSGYYSIFSCAGYIDNESRYAQNNRFVNNVVQISNNLNEVRDNLMMFSTMEVKYGDAKDTNKESGTIVIDYNDTSYDGRSYNPRPQLSQWTKGVPYFDTTLNKPIWWNGTEWVDSDSLDADSTGWALIE